MYQLVSWLSSFNLSLDRMAYAINSLASTLLIINSKVCIVSSLSHCASITLQIHLIYKWSTKAFILGSEATHNLERTLASCPGFQNSTCKMC